MVFLPPSGIVTSMRAATCAMSSSRETRIVTASGSAANANEPSVPERVTRSSEPRVASAVTCAPATWTPARVDDTALERATTRQHDVDARLLLGDERDDVAHRLDVLRMVNERTHAARRDRRGVEHAIAAGHPRLVGRGAGTGAPGAASPHPRARAKPPDRAGWPARARA